MAPPGRLKPEFNLEHAMGLLLRLKLPDSLYVNSASRGNQRHSKHAHFPALYSHFAKLITTNSVSGVLGFKEGVSCLFTETSAHILLTMENVFPSLLLCSSPPSVENKPFRPVIFLYM